MCMRDVKERTPRLHFQQRDVCVCVCVCVRFLQATLPALSAHPIPTVWFHCVQKPNPSSFGELLPAFSVSLQSSPVEACQGNKSCGGRVGVA